jgi:glycosyltransferase involved in cell wall biosynthesis
MIRTANLTASVSRNAGGLFDGVRRLVQSLIETGMDACVFGVRDEFTDADIGAWHPANVRAFNPVLLEKFGYSPRFREELTAFQPDITHTHGVWTYASAATSVHCRNARSPYLISPHGMLDSWAVNQSRRKKAIAHFLFEGRHLRGARCLRALCEAEARAMRQLGLTNEIAVIPNGIDLPNGEQPGVPCWEGIIEPGKKIMLYLGRIHPKKGLINLLRAWQLANKDSQRASDSWVLAIAGWDQGGHESELRRLATEIGIDWTALNASNRSGNGHGQSGGHQPATAEKLSSDGWRAKGSVIFLGPQFEKAKAACYQNCDAFILPSLSEGLPMVVLEAWAHGKPVLMTPECNLPEGFGADAALRIEPSVDSIARGLATLFQSARSDLQATGSRGRELVAERFAWPKIAIEMKSVYEWILGGGQKPDCVQPG